MADSELSDMMISQTTDGEQARKRVGDILDQARLARYGLADLGSAGVVPTRVFLQREVTRRSDTKIAPISKWRGRLVLMAREKANADFL